MRAMTSRMSKGETGKFLMLLALSQRPELLVLDEPTDGLDPVVRREVMTAVVDFVSQRGATVFISSHLVHEAERMCDWIGVMDRGRLVAEMPTDSFKGGIKRLRITGAPAAVEGTPFVLLSRERGEGVGAAETWVVRGWKPLMHQYFDQLGARLNEVEDLDLEDGFVELLRTFRAEEHVIECGHTGAAKALSLRLEKRHQLLPGRVARLGGKQGLHALELDLLEEERLLVLPLLFEEELLRLVELRLGAELRLLEELRLIELLEGLLLRLLLIELEDRVREELS